MSYVRGIDDFKYDPALALYLPLHELDGASFMSKDAYGHLLTVTGALWTPRGRTVDGDDFITATSALFAGTQDVSQKTIIYWVYTPNNTLYGNTISCRDAGGCNWQIQRGTGAYDLRLYDGTTSQDTGYDFIQNAWTFVAVTIDGVADRWLVYTGTPAIAPSLVYTFASRNFGADDGGTVLNIGRYSAGAFDASGTFGEVVIVNALLNLSRIMNTYLSTKWRYR